MLSKLNKYPPSLYAMLVILILHLVGLVSILSPLKDVIVAISWLNLAICGGIAIAFQPKFKAYKWSYISWLLLAFSVGLVTEGIGTNTGLLFGNYTYGTNLGWKLYGVPLIIGLNWTYLSIGAASISRMFVSNIWLQSLFAAALMLLLDFVMEPVAVYLEFWQWQNGVIPLKNYFSWFFIALPLVYLYLRNIPNNVNKVAILLYLVQLIFFAVILLQII